METYLPTALGFFAGLSAGLGLALGLCVWWVKTMQRVAFEEHPPSEVMGEGSEGNEEDCTVIEEESEEWWKKG